MADLKTCPECRSEIPADAAVCRCCGERIEGRSCPECRSVCKPEARKCRWCGHQFYEAVRLEDFKPFEVRTSTAGALLSSGSPIPQTVRFTRERIFITTFGFLGLYSADEEIPWDRVSGFSYRSGLLWDDITLQTRGQTPARLRGLRKRDGRAVRRFLQSLQK